VQEAAAKFLHICGSDFYFEGMAALCERLARLAPGKSPKRVFLTNSGTEATEGAIKLARHATRRTAIIAFKGAFHGRTTGALALTYSKARQHSGFGPLLPDVQLATELTGDKDALDVIAFTEAPLYMALPFLAPAGIPADRAAALRSAFMAMVRDREFLADAERSKLDITPIDGEALRAIIAKMAATPRAVIERYNRITGVMI
jgi:hypothetical protein